MTFSAPPFAKFRNSTLSLDVKYSTVLGRYKIVVEEQAKEASFSVAQNSLDVLIARTNDLIRCKTDRETQIAVFTQLVDELRQIPKEDEQKIRQGTLFLLGSLIHRYFRILKEYDYYNSYASWTYFGKSDVTSCKLFLAIRKALQFKDLELIKKKYREDDLRILDVVTIVKSLEVFQKNMFLEDERKMPRYMKYPHYADEKKHFKGYLQDIINEHSKRGAHFLNRFKAISFLQSLANEIDNQHQQLEKDLQKWCKGVIKDYKDFNTFKSLDEQGIEASVKKYVESEKSRNIILDLFYTPLIKGKMELLDSKNFYDNMLECYDNTCSYMLFGGYALLLHQYSSSLDQDLLFVFKKALGLESSLDTLTKQDMLDGVKFLQKFIETEPEAALDYEFFGSKDRMDTVIARSERELTEQTSPKENTAVLVC